MVIYRDWLSTFLTCTFGHLFLGQIELQSLDVVFHFSELLLFDCILATHLFERDVVLGHLFELGRSYNKLLMVSYNEEYNKQKAFKSKEVGKVIDFFSCSHGEWKSVII